MMKNNEAGENIVIRKAGMNEAETIYNLMKHVYDNLEDKNMFVCDTLDYVREQLASGAIAVVAEYKGEIVGSFITRYPYDSEDNLGIDIGLDKEELDKVMHMESAVVHEKYRGRGLQSEMIKYVEAQADTRLFSHMLATVAPDNNASILSFQKNGYEIIMQKKKYSNLDRAILYKKMV